MYGHHTVFLIQSNKVTIRLLVLSRSDHESEIQISDF